MTGHRERQVVVGQTVLSVELAPDAIRLLRFGAVTRNAHLIHYDTEFARSEGLAGPVVMAQLHGCLFHRAAAEFAGAGGQVREVGWRNRAPACVGDRLVVTGTVRSVDAVGGEITLDLIERCGSGEVVCCQGRAVVVLG
ncbi:acyl dehydratase [Streptomyces sp. NBC_00986]|uniref:acyl dehydratase n=1 Tax=Streptomyces sp. NBC_00986 TaxID=2903702 RepID=UPI003868BDD4|nr:acyl dehydratase [Streptomyces sp. NBC_00986]